MNFLSILEVGRSWLDNNLHLEQSRGEAEYQCFNKNHIIYPEMIAENAQAPLF